MILLSKISSLKIYNYRQQDGNNPSKFCVLGQAGFPRIVPERHHSGGFPLNNTLRGCPRQSLIAT